MQVVNSPRRQVSSRQLAWLEQESQHWQDAETLAFFGTLLFGNAIWLVAQILHIQGRYPDAFLWWGLGVLACAWLVRSQGIGVEAAALVLLWVAMEGEFSAGPAVAFLLVWPLAIAVAYSLGSSLMIRIAGPAAALWVFFGGMGGSHSALWLGGIALTACALYGAGRMRYAWEASGLIVLLLVFIPLMFTSTHKELAPGNAGPVAVAILGIAALTAWLASVRPARAASDNAVLAVSAATAAWTIASWWGVLGSGAGFALSATVLFSLLALVMCVSLIRTALATGRHADLAAGVMFAVVFLIVRWTSVIENLLWSGLLLLSAGAGLLVLARLWRTRARTAATAGRMS